MATTYYDSAQSRTPLLSEFRSWWEHRGLLRLIVGRELTARYKRSVLGVWWTLLNPLLTTAVLWLVFSQIFRFEMDPPTLPYIVYLLSGILFITYFGQGVIAAGSAVVNNSSILSKVFVPPEVFSFGAALASAANFLFVVIPLLIVQLIAGVGIPPTAPLALIPIVALLILITGIGLLVAAGAVFFYDVIDLTNVLIQLISYLTPTFYPISIVPDRFLAFIQANPLYSYLITFRAFIYEGAWPPAWNLAVMGTTSLVFLVLGMWVFSRSWRRLVVLL